MKNSFLDILREPDSVLFQFEDSGTLQPLSGLLA